MILGSPAVREDGFYITKNDTLYSRHGDLRRRALQHLAQREDHRRYPLLLDRFPDCRLRRRGKFGANAPDLPAHWRGRLPASAHGARLECRNTNALDPQSIGRYKEQGQTLQGRGSIGSSQTEKLIYAQRLDRLPPRRPQPSAAHPRNDDPAFGGCGCPAVQVGNAHQLRSRCKNHLEQHVPLQRRRVSGKVEQYPV